MSDNCLFCKIVSGEVPADIVFEDSFSMAFRDINPQAPTHVLFIPKEHISSIADTNPSHKDVLGHMLLKAAEFAKDSGFSENGYRIVINTNEDGGQTVFHLHIHLLGGRKFTFPPG